MLLIKPIFSHKNIFLFGLFLVIVGMPLSRFLISVGQFVLLGNWLLEGDFKRKWQVMKTSKVLWVLSSFYLLHLLGLLWTADFNYAENDLRIKLPLLWFPLLFITSKHEITQKEIQGLLWLFVFAIFISTIVSTLVWLGYTKRKVVDIREISIFNSHIRFALMIDLCVCFLLYDFFKTKNLFLYLLKITFIAWFIVFLGIMQSLTGIFILSSVMIYYGFLFLKNLRKISLKIIAFTAISLGALFLTYLLLEEIKSQQISVNPITRLSHTSNGHLYYNDTTNFETENGNLVWANVCNYELELGWKKRSKITINEKDRKGNPIYFTLVRYLSSRGLNKDATGLAQLSKKEIVKIENGITNYKYTNKTGIKQRIYELTSEYTSYKSGGNPEGHSLLMRLEFWRVGMDIIKREWLFGVGTGDVQNAYINQYVLSKSKLSKDWYKRSHNQFLAITIAFGVLGLIVFLVYLFYPIVVTKNKHYLFSAFFIISLLSMLNEDTLETQAGVTFFGFFYALLSLSNRDFVFDKK